MLTTAIAASALAFAPAQAAANDPFKTCLVQKITDNDRVAVVRWVFAMYSMNDRIADLSTVTPSQREALSKQVGTIVNRLLTQECRAEAVTALRTSDSKADEVIGKAFEEVGKAASDGLMADPKVERAMLGILEGIDVRAWSEIMLDAGIDPVTGSPKKAR